MNMMLQKGTIWKVVKDRRNAMRYLSVKWNSRQRNYGDWNDALQAVQRSYFSYFFGLILIFIIFLQNTYFFGLVCRALFQNAVNYCLGVCITCTIIKVNIFQ